MTRRAAISTALSIAMGAAIIAAAISAIPLAGACKPYHFLGAKAEPCERDRP